MDRLDAWHERLADRVSAFAASPWALIPVAICVVGWWLPFLVERPTIFEVAIAATETTAFGLLLLLQRASHKESLATQVKFDELLRAVKDARNEVIHADELSERDLDTLDQDIKRNA